jgi:putative cardiolipin synthase
MTPTLRAAARLACALSILAAGCASLPPLEGRIESTMLPETADTALGRAVAPIVAGRPGKTGIHAMTRAADAFAARMLLAAAAQRSIDAQYYIWRGDQTGMLLLQSLRAAARRGVRVRLLLDDQNTSAIEDELASLAAEPGMELRLYNPFASRRMRFLDYLGDFARVNRRMHNKAFVADNQAAVVGGRNIGNEYFAFGTEVPFKDLDVLAVGAAVHEVSAQFDLYWNSASAYPAAVILGPPAPGAGESLDARFSAARADSLSLAYLDVVRETPLVSELLERRLALEWADARVLRDDPAKTLDKNERRDLLMLSTLVGGGARPRASLDIISPYFVPAQKGTEALEGLARAGVRVRVLTNSLAATDVGVVHSGYAKWRCRLARAGVTLYELKPELAPEAHAKGKPASSAASLHAKTFAADRERIFVGSFNFDPRSALLNTEMGLAIASPALAARLSDAFDGVIPRNAYEVRARPDEPCVEWIERTASGEVTHATEPRTSWAQRAWVAFLSAFPLDWLL